MKNIMIKIVVVLLATSVYFNVSQIFEMKTLNERNETLQESIAQLEELQNEENTNLENDETIEDSCNKLYEITVQVVSEDDDFDQSIIVCTNKVYLGDALDEISEDLELQYDPNYSKDYVYGRMIVSVYGISKNYEEYFAITINSIYSNVGLDYIEIEDDYSYAFTP